MSVMACRFVVTSLMVLSRLPMMSGGVFVVFSSFSVMLRTFMLSHCVPLPSEITRIGIAGLLLSVVFNRITGPLKESALRRWCPQPGTLLMKATSFSAATRCGNGATPRACRFSQTDRYGTPWPTMLCPSASGI